MCAPKWTYHAVGGGNYEIFYNRKRPMGILIPYGKSDIAQAICDLLIMHDAELDGTDNDREVT